MHKKEKLKRRSQSFAKNAAILTVTSLLLRGAGMYFRIYVSSLVGAEGMGLYQLIISVYALFSGFASSGIGVAVTRMTAEELVRGSKKTVRTVLYKCMGVSLAMGVTSAALLIALAVPIGESWISDARSVLSIRIMAFSLPFMSISCCLRGYFTARSKVSVPSAAQMTEQMTRIIAALLLLRVMMPLGVEYACLAIMIADVISEAAGCLFAVCGYIADRKREFGAIPQKTALDYRVGKRIWDIAAPITASHYLSTLLRTTESVLVPDCLCIFLASREKALELFGMIKGMALPLILFPSSLLAAFSSLLVPELSRAATLGSLKKIEQTVSRTMRITFGLSIPIAAIFALYSTELGILVYDNSELGSIILFLSPLMPLMYVESVTVGLLRGLGEQKSSLIYSVSDSAIRIVLIILLVRRFGLNGFLSVMLVSNLYTPLLHIRRLLKVTGMKFNWSEWVLLPLLISSLLASIARLFSPLFCTLPMWIEVGIGAVMVSPSFFAIPELRNFVGSYLPKKRIAIAKASVGSGRLAAGRRAES